MKVSVIVARIKLKYLRRTKRKKKSMNNFQNQINWSLTFIRAMMNIFIDVSMHKCRRKCQMNEIRLNSLNHPNKVVVFFQNALFTISWWHHLTTLQLESIITLNSQLSKICLYRLQCELIDGYYGYEFMSLMNIEWT